MSRRKRIAVAGATGALPHLLGAGLAPRHEVVVLTGGAPHSAPREGVSWCAWDRYSLAQTERALRDVDAAIYLGRGPEPPARLVQGSQVDLDLFCADTFARAARAVGIELVVDAAIAMSAGEEGTLPRQSDSSEEVSQALRSVGVPVLSIPLEALPSDAASGSAPTDALALLCWAVDHPELASSATNPTGVIAAELQRLRMTVQATDDLGPLREALAHALAETSADEPQTVAGDERRDPHAGSRVRSVQRLALPPGRNAEWVADEYVRWLPGFVGSMVRVEVDAARRWRFHLPLAQTPLLVVELVAARSSPDRQLFRVSGGALARTKVEGDPRLEFRTAIGGRVALAALLDFVPRLPWPLYRVTQALLHARVMARFGNHLETVARSDAQPRAPGG